MSSALDKWGAQIAAAAIPLSDVQYGPWLGSYEAISADQINKDFIAGSASSNWLYIPRGGTWKRRGGQTQKFDTFGAHVGLLPAKWLSSSTPTYCKARQMDEFSAGSISDSVPTVCALVTKEAVAEGLDDGWFSNFYVRDQVLDLDYTLGSEYSGESYPAVGSTQTYRFVPLWHESGDGGITRGVSEFQRRLFLPGSRRFLRSGNWFYFPNLKGTPCRAAPGSVEPAEGSEIFATGDVAGTFTLQSGGGEAFKWAISDLQGGLTTAYECLATDEGDNTNMVFINNAGVLLFPFSSTVSTPALSASYTQWVVRCRVKLTVSYTGDATFWLDVTLADGNKYRTSIHSIEDTSTPGSWVTLEFFLNTNTDLVGTGTANRITLAASSTGSFTPGFYVGRLAVAPLSSAASSVNRLFPSGPIPPTHAGTLARGNVATAGSSPLTFVPNADESDGNWNNNVPNQTALFSYVDESTTDDADYIQSETSTTVGDADPCTLGLADFGFTPEAGSTVRIHYRARSNGRVGALRVELMQGATSRALTSVAFPNITTTVQDFVYQLTEAEIAAVTDWNALSLRFTSISGDTSVGYNSRVTRAYVAYAPPGGAAEGAWLGKDRFFYSVAYRFEDGSVWMPCAPRMPSSTLTAGFNLFTVDEANADVQYDFITWSNVPIGPHGVVGRLLLRTPKVDSSTEGDELKLNPYDFRLVAELTDNTTTTYVDYQADDFGLAEDSAGLYIRYDHIMPPRARYIAGGDMRVVHAYGGQNPCAIVFAPVGKGDDSSTYDLNLLDSDSTAYASTGSYYRLRLDSNGDKYLDLVQSDGASLTGSAVNLNLATYNTLEKLVDAINATTFATNTQTWRAQLCPGANPSAPSTTALTPTRRQIASVVTVNTDATITKAGGGLSAVPVGAFVSGTGITAGTYVTRIDSDTSLELSAAATANGTVTLTFYADTGDTAITGEVGYVRVIANSLPGFLYFNEPYLDDDPIDKTSIWMTTATPGSMRSAANNFSGKTANRFSPPTGAGIAMGAAAVDQGFVVPYSGGVYALKNTRDSSSGVDEDYKLIALNETAGCCAWATVNAGPGFAHYLKPEGLFAADLEREIKLSDAIWDHATQTGGLSYEMPLCIVATGQDDDTAYASARVLRSAIWLNYRASGAHPNRQVVYDFSDGPEMSGLRALLRENGTPWGWSTPLVRADGVTAMCEGRRTTTSHLYGWNEENDGSAGGGRIDEFETGSTDNGTAITAVLVTPWLKPPAAHMKLSAQEYVIEHNAPSGATVLLDFYRSYSEAAANLALSTTTLVVGREFKMLPQVARAVTAAGYTRYRQTAGSAAVVRAFVLRVKWVQSYK